MGKEVHRIYFCENGAILDTQLKSGEDTKDTLNRCFNKITQLQDKLALTEKALELAIEHISIYSDSCVYCEESWRRDCPCREMWGSKLCYEYLKKCLIKEAKEMMKSE